SIFFCMGNILTAPAVGAEWRRHCPFGTPPGLLLMRSQQTTSTHSPAFCGELFLGAEPCNALYVASATCWVVAENFDLPIRFLPCSKKNYRLPFTKNSTAAASTG